MLEKPGRGSFKLHISEPAKHIDTSFSYAAFSWYFGTAQSFSPNKININ
jgi:hypothetical protein